MMRTFKAALFDLDGTLFDTEGQYSVFWGEIGRRFRPDVPNLDKVIKGTTLKQIFERYFPDPEVQKIVNVELDLWEASMRYTFIEGALEFIEDIRRHGVKCAVVTSSNDKKMQSVRKQMPQFDTLFDRVLTAEMFKASKPDPDCYILGASVFGLANDECVIFEDAFTGLESAMRSGSYTVGLATNNAPEAIKDKCHTVIADFRGLTYERVVAMLK